MINCQRNSCAGCPDIETCREADFLIDLQAGQADEADPDLRLISAFAENAGYEEIREVEGAGHRVFVLK